MSPEFTRCTLCLLRWWIGWFLTWGISFPLFPHTCCVVPSTSDFCFQVSQKIVVTFLIPRLSCCCIWWHVSHAFSFAFDLMDLEWMIHQAEPWFHSCDCVQFILCDHFTIARLREAQEHSVGGIQLMTLHHTNSVRSYLYDWVLWSDIILNNDDAATTTSDFVNGGEL